jgi:mono/diheme cytochrome c family protein
MLKHFAVIAMIALFPAGMSCANQTTPTVKIPLTRTTPTSGKQMFTSYCTPCHGQDGKGNGPVASALKSQPIDLTTLARNNNGRFPAVHVTAVLQSGVNIPAHGTAAMPVWGPILGKMDVANPQDRGLRISNLSHYLRTMQEK